MDVREKLVELLDGVQHYGTICTMSQMDDRYASITQVSNTEAAEKLIAQGVTVQKWISVKDRLPEQGQEVIVYSGGVLKPTVFAYQFWNKNYDSWARITHWMPLPQPPKGD